jgi:hypothetical protein
MSCTFILLQIVVVICLSVLHTKANHNKAATSAIFKPAVMVASGYDNVFKRKPTKWKTLHVLSSFARLDEVPIIDIME